MQRDLIVIGGGAGGLSAARSAARRGARPLLVQDGPLGGDCTFMGCVPSKTLISAAKRGAPFPDAMRAVRQAITTVARMETDDVLHSEGVEVRHGRATFVSPREIEIDGSRLQSKRFIIATGGAPAVPPIEGLDRVPYLTNESVFDLEVLPTSLVVLGGGAIGCELAQAFARLGSHVTIFQTGPRLLPKEEPDASEVILEAFRSEAIDVRLGQTVSRVERAGEEIIVHPGVGESVTASHILVAAGRRAITGALGLDAAGVATNRGFVQTDDALKTTASGIWAVGDVAGKLQFTHAADEMGRIAAANALTRRPPRRFHPEWIPWVTYTDPEVGRIGAAEADVQETRARVAELPMSEVDRAIAAGETRGFVKLIAGPRPILRSLAGGRVIGATIVATRAGEMINEVSLAVRTDMFVARLAQTVHAYPSWSVALQQAAAQFFLETGGRRARPVATLPPEGV